MEAPSLSLVFRLPHERVARKTRDGSPLNLTYHTFNKTQRREGEAYAIEPRTPLFTELPRADILGNWASGIRRSRKLVCYTRIPVRYRSVWSRHVVQRAIGVTIF